ncbi:type II secretion system F family protein [bacterium]|nr:type II secretion system F family protein [candidate division CSSED10-310 bacterium]
MPHYRYKATEKTGKLSTGVMEGASEAAVIQKLRDQHMLPISVESTKSSDSGLAMEFDFTRFFSRIRLRDVMELTSKLSTLVDAGVTLDRSLAITTELTENPKMKGVVRDVRRKVQGGASFGEALAQHPRVFNRLYVNMVRSGEAGGVLDTILQRLTGFLEESEELRQEIVSQSIYPILLIIVSSVVVTLMVTFVLPKFTVIFDSMGADLPLPTKILVNAVNFIKHSWYFILGAIVLLVAVFKQYINTREGRLKWDDLKLKLPMIGKLLLKIEIARFSRTLGTLVRSGVPILQALSIVKETVTNQVIADSLLSVYSKLKEGGGLANPLRETGCFPPLAVHMIAVGEETGSFETMLIKVADTYESDVRVTIKRVMAAIEPALIVIMGALIGFIVLSMLMAVFSVADMPI